MIGFENRVTVYTVHLIIIILCQLLTSVRMQLVLMSAFSVPLTVEDTAVHVGMDTVWIAMGRIATVSYPITTFH